MTRRPLKRPAYEPAAAPVTGDPDMPRPASTLAGATLVLLRAVAGAVWMLAFALHQDGFVMSLSLSFSGDAADAADLSTDTSTTLLVVVLAIVGAGVLFEATLGVLILRGSNWPRVLVMVLSVLSISSAFIGWWVQGQEIRIETTFVTLSLDVLILLALSSRGAAAYARRRARH